MTAICFGPPPLPPNKKSLGTFNRSRKHLNYSPSLLSSTYLSFPDPAEENEIVSFTTEEIELTDRYKDTAKVEKQRGKKLTHTNSLSRYKNPKVNLIRSQSDGNLNKTNKRDDMQPMTINKYVKMLSGSWKNLLNRKFVL